MNRIACRSLATTSKSPLSVTISEEIQHALATKSKPVVSLESTIITHGLPYPENLSMAKRVEQTIRDNGGIPATCAFLNGKPYVGLTESVLGELAENTQSANKVSRRDIGYVMANKQNGGTTIASTMILSKLAGIKVFATGGLGGVHRDGQFTMDVSADLTELGRTPVSVVCAGPKSILDIGLTLEFLETQGVFVGTYNDTNRSDKSSIEVPGFYARDSGFKSPYSFDSFKEAASIIHMQNNVMQLESGNLFCIPPSKKTALPSDMMSKIIAEANDEAKELKIEGKELTPFLLGKIAKVTKGKSVKSNIELVLNNARAATEIAKELLKLETDGTETVSFQPSTRIGKAAPPKGNSAKEKRAVTPIEEPQANVVNTLIIGSLALDSICKVADKLKMKDSNPGSISSSIGGVGFNVSKAASLGLASPSCTTNSKGNVSSRLVSVVADDFAGKSVLRQLKGLGFDTSGILELNNSSKKHISTAQYTSVHSATGDLVVACADMSIIENDAFTPHIIQEIARAQPKQIIVDCNLSSTAISAVLEFVNSNTSLSNCKVIIEPTSSHKARRIGQVHSNYLKPFPNNTVSLITPTTQELDQIYTTFNDRELFDDYDGWFPLLDSLGIDSTFRERLSISKEGVIQEGLQTGYLQQAFQLLPYIPHIVLKLGPEGVLVLTLSTSVDDYKSLPTTSKHSPKFTFTTQVGRTYTDDNGQKKKMGIAIQYFPVPKENQGITIENVTGAGDSFLGYLSARLSVANVALPQGTWLNTEISSVEEEWFKWESIYKSQLAAGESIQTLSSISDKLREI